MTTELEEKKKMLAKIQIGISQQEHNGYTEWKNAKARGYPIRQMFGQFQYIYDSPKGKISLVEFPDYFMDGKTIWEIYCLEGNLFDDVIRFKSKEEAEEKIKELLK